MFPNKVPLNLIESTFDATFSSVRDMDEKQPNGSYKRVKKELLKDLGCGLYVHRAEEYDARRSLQPLTGDFRIFTYQDADIIKGDILTVTQYGRTYKMICGEPIVYETHLEVVCREEGLA